MLGFVIKPSSVKVTRFFIPSSAVLYCAVGRVHGVMRFIRGAGGLTRDNNQLQGSRSYIVTDSKKRASAIVFDAWCTTAWVYDSISVSTRGC